MVQYGYIIDKMLFNGQANDVQWDFSRYNQDQTTTDYNGIETSRDLSADSNIIIIGSNLDFIAWRNEFMPIVE